MRLGTTIAAVVLVGSLTSSTAEMSMLSTPPASPAPTALGPPLAAPGRAPWSRWPRARRTRRAAAAPQPPAPRQHGRTARRPPARSGQRRRAVLVGQPVGRGGCRRRDGVRRGPAGPGRGVPGSAGGRRRPTRRRRYREHRRGRRPGPPEPAPRDRRASTEGAADRRNPGAHRPAHAAGPAAERRDACGSTAWWSAWSRPGSTATVDVRGRDADGNWSEWIPTGGSTGSSVTLPRPAVAVQGRLVLTGPPTELTATLTGPAVRGVTLTVHPLAAARLGRPPDRRRRARSPPARPPTSPPRPPQRPRTPHHAHHDTTLSPTTTTPPTTSVDARRTTTTTTDARLREPRGHRRITTSPPATPRAARPRQQRARRRAPTKAHRARRASLDDEHRDQHSASSTSALRRRQQGLDDQQVDASSKSDTTLDHDQPPADRVATQPAGAPLKYRVFATREGLVGGTTANGHVIKSGTCSSPCPRGGRWRRATAATTRSRCAPRTAAAPSRRSGTSARGTPATTTGTRRPAARSGATCPGAAAGTGRQAERLQRRPGPVRAQGGQPGRASTCPTACSGTRSGSRTTPGSPSTTCGPARGTTAQTEHGRRAGEGRARAVGADGSLARWPRWRSGSRERGRARCRPRSPRCWSAPGPRSATASSRRGGRCSRCVVAVALVIGVNYANDYSDGIRGTDDERVGPVRLVGSRAAAPAAVRNAAFAASRSPRLAGLTLVSLSGQWWLVAVGAAVHRRGLVLHRRAAALRLRRARRGGRLRVLRAGGGARHGDHPERHGRARWPWSPRSASAC